MDLPMTNALSAEDEFSPEEIARRRDEVIRRMANTPPQPRVSPKAPAKAAKEPAEDRGLSRSRRGRGASAKPSAQE
jgi:hypothetical protein